MTTYPIEKRCKDNRELIVLFTAPNTGKTVTAAGIYPCGYISGDWTEDMFEPTAKLYTIAEIADDLENVLTWDSKYGCLEWRRPLSPANVVTKGPIFDEFKRRHHAKQAELDALAASIPVHLRDELIERLKNA